MLNGTSPRLSAAEISRVYVDVKFPETSSEELNKITSPVRGAIEKIPGLSVYTIEYSTDPYVDKSLSKALKRKKKEG